MKLINLLVRSLTLASAILLSVSLSAQNNTNSAISLPYESVELEDTAYLEDQISNYIIFESNFSAKDLQLKNNSKLSLPLDGLNFEVSVFTDNVNISQDLAHEVILLGGTERSGGQVSLTLADNFIYGYIMKGDTKYYIQPLTHFDKKAKDNQYICYSEHDLVAPTKEHKCGHTIKTKLEEKLTQKSVASECRIMNIAIANTNDMLVKHGSEQNVINLNLGILNNVQTDFRSEFDVNLEFNLTGHYVAASPSLDPFDNNQSSTNASLLLPAFRNWASDGTGGLPGGTQGGFATAFDIAIVWTARDLNQDGGDIIGLAYTPGWFQILEDYTNTASRLQVLLAHETGHNLGADHDLAESNTIMAPTTTVTNHWSTQSVNDIDNYLTYLTNLPACHTAGAPVPFFFKSSSVICQNSSVIFEDQSRYGETSSWTFEGATIASSTDPKPNVTFTDLGYQVVNLTSFNAAGSNDYSSYVLVQAEPTVNCIPNDSANSGGISNFSLENINHDSPLANAAGTYENNICQGVANLIPGNSHDLRISLDGVSYVRFFFDYNGDGDFDNANESTGLYSIPNNGTYIVSIQTDANPLMNTLLRMRVITSDMQISNSCFSATVGQVEDYGMFFGTPQVLGCTNPGASNYDPAATIDDGSCNTTTTLTTWYEDSDNDNYGNPSVAIASSNMPAGFVANNSDCDDNNPNINPASAEVCDDIDNNCNNQTDEGLDELSYYVDSDGDGYGSNQNPITSCSAPSGYVILNNDCDDNNPNINPGASELCDGVDNNCNNQTDENTTLTTYYLDSDGDGYGSSSTLDACTQPAGYVTNATDCDDNNPNINPGASELCDGLDNNCNNQTDENTTLTTFYLDSDGDGYGSSSTLDACTQPAGYVTNATDCDDNNPNINPGASELCDGLDNNCNNQTDENTTLTTFYLDSDGDGYGSASTLDACTQPAGYVTNATDCDDNNPNINPGASELCDGLDNNCNNQTDENTTLTTFYLDSDGDGYGSADNSMESCDQPIGYVANATDCNDNNPLINPGQPELCDGLDNNCNNQTDENTTLTTFYLDSDGDGYGSADNSMESCDQPIGYVANATDCNDNNPLINPGQPELCDGLDNNCNNQADENTNVLTYYLDNDGDGYGSADNSMESCDQPIGYVANATDCNDNNPLINPGQPELCDGLDNNCNNQADENTTVLTYYLDNDGDGYGSADNSIESCDQPIGYVANATDCNDNNPLINPGQPELCDGLDNNCNNQADENTTVLTYYLDNDGDGYGSADNSIESCDQPTGYVANATDCNDNNPLINPGQPELCDGLDNNCNNQADENTTVLTYYLDNDGDGYGSADNSIESCDQPIGYVANGTDCNDNNPLINLGRPELCDGLDNNCNNQADENTTVLTYYLDNDGDGYGSADNSMESCDQPIGYVANATDCNDNNPLINPGQPELCDGLDNNCNNQADENTNVLTYYLDNDGDGYGSADNSMESCDQPIGYVANATDCNDGNPLINPGQPELCDGLDNNCNNQADENTSTTTYYLDSDGDGYGSADNSMESCDQPIGYVANGTDCNDGDPLINPGQPELCDGLDNNCNNQADENTSTTTYYLDSDGDGYGSGTESITDCNQPQGYVSNANDCDDTNPTINPAESELCDGIDNNCSGNIDEGLVDETLYLDNDGDGFGNDSEVIISCDQPDGYVLVGGDCNDNDRDINPMAEEPCDDIDNNCNGIVDEESCNSISGTIWEDTNGNNVFDSDEEGISDVKIILEYLGKSSVFQETITDENGYYDFTDLENGEYYLVFDISGLPDNMIVEYDDKVLMMSNDGNSLATLPFALDGNSLDIPMIGIYESGYISGNFYTAESLDMIESWAFLYTKETDTVIDSTFTVNGRYSFSGLKTGNYYIEFVAPSNSQFLTEAPGNASAINLTFMDNTNTMLGQTISIDIIPGAVITDVNAVLTQGQQTLSLDDRIQLEARWDADQNKVMLRWSMTETTDWDIIRIKRSLKSNSDFETIETLSESTASEYRLEDNPGMNAVFYYRIASVTESSKEKYSNLASVKTDYQQKATLAPNPAQNEVRLQLSHSSKKVQITVGDKKGRVTHCEIQKLDELNYLINTESLVNGIYYIRIESDHSVSSQKLIIIK